MEIEDPADVAYRYDCRRCGTLHDPHERCPRDDGEIEALTAERDALAARVAETERDAALGANVRALAEAGDVDLVRAFRGLRRVTVRDDRHHVADGSGETLDDAISAAVAVRRVASEGERS